MLTMPAILVSAPRCEGAVLYACKERIRQLAWTPRGTLLAITDAKVTELPGGRTRSLLRRRVGGDSLAPPRLAFSSSGTKAIGNGFVLNIKTLDSKPIRRAGWDSDRLVEIVASSPGRYTMRSTGRSVTMAPGWFVLGFSSDLRLALACRKEPFDGDTTCLLRIDPRSGRGSVVARYPKTSDDHTWLRFAQGSGPGGRILVHSEALAGGLTTPFLAGRRLRPIVLPHARSLIQTTARAEWIRPSPWAIVRRTLMLDRQENGFDADVLDLWNARTGRTIRVAKATGDWRGRRGDEPKLGTYAVDWPHRRVAYVVLTPTESRVFVHWLREEARLVTTRVQCEPSKARVQNGQPAATILAHCTRAPIRNSGLHATVFEQRESHVYCQKGAVRAVSRDGRLKWERKGFAEDSTLFAIRGDRVLVRESGGDAALTCLTDSGRVAWKIAGQEGAFEPLCVVSQRWLVYFAGGPVLGASAANPTVARRFMKGLQLRCVDATGGKPLWAASMIRLGMVIGASPRGNAFLALRRRGTVHGHSTFELLSVDAPASTILRRWHVDVTDKVEEACGTLAGLNLDWAIRARGKSIQVRGVCRSNVAMGVEWTLDL